MNYLNHYIRSYSSFSINKNIFSLIRLSNRRMNSSQAWHHWCNTHEPTIDIADPKIQSDACLWHINVHACAIGRSVSYCGPW
jgi:hypothetical protein